VSTPAQRSFAAGELSPALRARTDTVKYQSGAKTARNGRVMRHGGFESRPGFKFVSEVMDSTKTVRLVPYIHDGSTSYMLEFGDGYMRVIENGDLVSGVAKAITGISQASEGVVTIPAHGYQTGDYVILESIVGMTELNGVTARIEVNSVNTFGLTIQAFVPINTTAFAAYISGGTARRVAFVSPFAEVMLPLLKYAQETGSAIMTLVSGGNLGVAGIPPYQLTRSSGTEWTLAVITFAPSISAPSSLGNASFPDGNAAAWVVTALKEETLEESVASNIETSSTQPATANPNVLNWTAVADAAYYNVYKYLNGVPGFYGIAGSNSFTDTRSDVLPDLTQTPPVNYNPFSDFASGPATVTHFQSRQIFANNWFSFVNTSDVTTVWASKTGAFKNFSRSSPLRDDDSLRFLVPGRHEIRHLLDLKRLVILTSTGEFVADGNADGILLPGAINLKQESSNGASTLAPLVINSTALYVQARGSVVRSFGRQVEFQGYNGDELSIFSAHLVKAHTIVDWCYQQTPHSTVWVVRDDGVLLSMTYVPEQQIVGWARHDTDGIVENVACVPEGTEDVVYLVVKRTIGGVTKRYIERMANRDVTDATIKDFVGMDSAFTYDGRNTDDDFTMTVSDGEDWDDSETFSILASQSYFTLTDIGKAIHFEDADGVPLRLTITDYASDDVVYARAHRDVPVELQDVATSIWSMAIKTVTGLSHLEGKEVTVFADGYVVANPLRSTYGTPKTVTSGAITLDGTFAVIHIGLPFIIDLETLNIDTPQGESLVTRKKNVASVVLHLDDTRGIWVGAKPPTDDDEDPLENLVELKLRENETMEQAISLFSGEQELQINSEWNSNGRIFMRQVDPVPVTILAVVPDVAV
jgi:hypothetical protein